MLDALLKVWPILAGIGGVATAVLLYLGTGVWRVAKWTVEHDSRVDNLSNSVQRIDQRVATLEQRSLTQDSAIIRLEARK
jgi:hypothetical protein